MTSGDFALFVSGASFAIAAATLGWNIYSKFIYVKPAVQVTFGVYVIFDGTPRKKLLAIHATNMGPGPVILQSCIARSRRKEFHWRRRNRYQYGMLNPIEGDVTSEFVASRGPFSGGLPCKIEAGDVKAFYFPFAADSFSLGQNGLTECGVNDPYGRNHWCRKRDAKKVLEAFEKEFGNKLATQRSGAPTPSPRTSR